MAEQLDPDDILTAEFEYIAQGTFQVSEDRAKVSSFYLVTVGSLIAAILGTRFSDAPTDITYIVLAALFFLLSINGLITLLQLVQLRIAWLDSIAAMNQIKQYYIDNDRTALKDAFRWMDAPTHFKAWSISYLMAFQVAVLGGITLGAAITFLQGPQPWHWRLALPGLIGGGGFFLLQLALYRYLLQRQQEPS